MSSKVRRKPLDPVFTLDQPEAHPHTHTVNIIRLNTQSWLKKFKCGALTNVGILGFFPEATYTFYLFLELKNNKTDKAKFSIHHKPPILRQ